METNINVKCTWHLQWNAAFMSALTAVEGLQFLSGSRCKYLLMRHIVPTLGFKKEEAGLSSVTVEVKYS